MGGKTQYKTRQYNLIMSYLIELGEQHTTVPQLEAHFAAGGNSIGTATIYRHLEKLAAQGQVRKFLLDGVPGTCYQYQPEHEGCRDHFHLKCEQCGQLQHLDCAQTQSFRQHIQETHGFHANYSKTVIFGMCKDCFAQNAFPHT